MEQVEHPPVDCSVIIEAGDIKRDSALRKLVEKAPATSAAIACYPDDDAALEHMIDAQLATHGLSIGPAARTVLRHRLGEDRRANRNEIDKLALYCLGQTSVSEADVAAACGDMGEMAVDELIDAAATGNSAETARQLSRMQAGGIAPDMTMLTMLRHFQMLQAVRYQVDDKRLSAPAVIGSLRPPLHFSRRDAVTQALAAWNMPALQKALARLEEAAFECRAKPALGQSLASSATWAIAIEASRLRRSRA